MTDLLGEVIDAHRNIRRSHEDWLAARGVGPFAVYCPPPRLWGHWGVDKAQFHGDLYEPDPSGVPVMLLGVFDGPDEPILDIVAFEPTDPSRWYLRLGQAVVLGRHNARLALFEQTPLTVYPTPLAWLAADCRGCCVVDWKRELLSILDVGEEIHAADTETRKKLERAFRRDRHMPRVRVAA